MKPRKSTEIDHGYEAARDAWIGEQKAKEPFDHLYEQWLADRNTKPPVDGGRAGGV